MSIDQTHGGPKIQAVKSAKKSTKLKKQGSRLLGKSRDGGGNPMKTSLIGFSNPVLQEEREGGGGVGGFELPGAKSSFDVEAPRGGM
jgi:hypothetical protein